MRFASILLGLSVGASAAAGGTKTEHFDRDPGWAGFSNHPTVEKYPTIVQDFGYKDGAIGGVIFRTSTPAWYAAKIDAGMDQPLSVDVTVKLMHTGSSSGVLFGFFNSSDIPLAGRPRQSLMFHLGGRRDDSLVHLRIYNSDNEGAGTRIPDDKNKRTAPGLPADGKPHHLSLSYDPTTKKMHGQWDDFVATSDLGQFKPGTMRFDRFGVMNELKSGGPTHLLFTSIKFNGTEVDLTKDPAWDSHGNRVTFEDHDPSGTQAYGFSETNLAGGNKGELGGTMWRLEKPSFYGDRVGPFSLNDALHAEGKVTLTVGAPDSGILLGFFNADSLKKSETKNFVGVQVEGPTRVGHYFHPFILDSAGTKQKIESAQRILPDGKARKWSFDYDPAGDGTLTVTFDGNVTKIVLSPKLRAAGASVDHFGILPVTTGGNQVRIYIDDVTYTSSR